jgi:DNA topoisomerase-1
VSTLSLNQKIAVGDDVLISTAIWSSALDRRCHCTAICWSSAKKRIAELMAAKTGSTVASAAAKLADRCAVGSPCWRTARDETKFDRMVAFGSALPRLRATVKRDLAQPVGTTVSQPAVLATLVRLLETTMVRVSNDEYARANKSYGLNTLRKRQVALTGDKLRLKFRGKSGIEHEVALKDKRVARIVQRCQALPGQERFKYLDDAGQLHSVGAVDVNDYLRAASGGDFTAKDFRTWHGSATSLALFMQLDDAAQEAITATVANRLIAEVAQLLGNTVAVCRKSYIHPEVLALLLKTKTLSAASKAAQSKRKAGLTMSDCAFLAFLCTLQ